VVCLLFMTTGICLIKVVFTYEQDYQKIWSIILSSTFNNQRFIHGDIHSWFHGKTEKYVIIFIT